MGVLNEKRCNIIEETVIHYGTPELESDRNSNSINNVIDAHDVLKQIIQNTQIKADNINYYSKYKKLGDLHVYTDGSPVQFISIS